MVVIFAGLEVYLPPLPTPESTLLYTLKKKIVTQRPFSWTF
jgi:hypothetical protein